jgi:hypothetical protein
VSEPAAHSVIERILPDLRQRYGAEVGNGRACDRCGVYGMGTPAAHRADCSGVVLLRDAETAIASMGAS